MNRKSFLTALIWLAIVSPAWAVEPTANVLPVRPVAAGKMARIDASASTGDKFKWLSVSGDEMFVDSSGKLAFFASPTPGTYRFWFIAVGVKDGKADLAETVVELVVEGSLPPIPPEPPVPPIPPPRPPDPPPGPVVLGRLHATYIADADKLLPSHAALKSSKVIRDDLGSLDTSFRWYQSDEAEPARLNLLIYATKPGGPGLPCLIVQTTDGRIVASLKAPTETAIIGELQRLRGRK